MSNRSPGSGGAKAALDGFDYQLDVSILTALRLMLINKSATRITLEPANEEDLQADLEPAAPGRVQPSANLAEGYKLVVQVKLRNSGPWSISDFKALLKHGKARQPARCHLNDPHTRYLLITNADAAGAARKLLVRGLEEWPEEKTFPASLSPTLPHAPEGRIAIWGVLTEPHLDLEMNDILGSILRVPKGQQVACRNQLRGEALRRMKGTSPGVWTRDDLLGVIRGCGGFLASDSQLESFVPPANYQVIGDVFERHNAVVLSGPSGTGKTLTALALVEEARRQASPPEIIHVNANDGPSSMQTLVDTGPKLFHVEDPWGQNSLRGGADIWAEQLPRLLRGAHAGRRYVITSRTDMLVQARADQDLGRWTVLLDPDQYRNGELAAIYDKRLDLLATDLQAKALDFRTDALDALETPLEVDLFFALTSDGPKSGEGDSEFFRRTLTLAHREAVEGVVVDYLADSDDTGTSAIVWALLAARSQFDRNQLVRLNRKLRTVDQTITHELEGLVNRLVATRHLRQPGRIVSFSHPSVRAGFEKFIREDWACSEAALALFISALTQLDGCQREWALETAARSIKAITDFLSGIESLDVEFEADSDSRAEIDAWLEESLVDPRSDFRLVLQLAADVGTGTSAPSELARWLTKSVQRGGQMFLARWQPPIFDDAWYERVSADPRSFKIADRYVREQLLHDWGAFGDDFADRLDRIASGLTPAFVAAAREIVASDFDGNASALAAGAVRDLDSYEDVLDAALNERARVNGFHQREGKEQWRAINDGERDEADEEGYVWQHADDGHTADVFVAAYVKRVRSLGHGRRLATHPRKAELGRAWAEAISKASGSVSPEELRTVIGLTRSSGDEELAWGAVRQHWHASLASDLEERILSTPDDDRLRAALANCALMASPETLALCLERFSAAPASFIHLLVDMLAACRRIPGDTPAQRVRPLLKAIPGAGKEIFRALLTKDKSAQAVGQEALTLLGDAAETVPPFVLDKIVPVMIASGSAPSATIRRWLAETEDHQLAKSAAEAAVRVRDDALVRIALAHARADARRVALVHLASTLPDPLPEWLLELASDPGSRVRRSLVRILTDRIHPNHQNVLVRLIDDKWSDAELLCNEPPSYPIAREAIAGLAAYGSLSDEIGKALLLRAKRTADRSLGIAALNTAAQCCGHAIRKKIWALASCQPLRWVRVDAIDALSGADVVEVDILDEITGDFLLDLEPDLAASACVLLAIHGKIDAVITTMERIAHSTKKRALLLLGAFALADRDRDAAVRLLQLLGSGHPAQRLLDLKDGEQLPKSALDDLGHVRFRRVVRGWLYDRIAKD